MGPVTAHTGMVDVRPLIAKLCRMQPLAPGLTSAKTMQGYKQTCADSSRLGQRRVLTVIGA